MGVGRGWTWIDYAYSAVGGAYEQNFTSDKAISEGIAKAISERIAKSISEDLESIKGLITSGFTVDQHTNRFGKTLLHIASQNDRCDIATYLVDKKANVNASDIDGNTPLHDACGKDSAMMAEVLLNSKADMEARDNHGRTPLYVACLAKNLKITKVLLASKADIKARNKQGKSMVLATCTKGDIAMVKCLLNSKADVKAVDNENNGALHLACQGGNLALIKFLVTEHKLDVRGENTQGKTPLFIAREREDLEMATYLESAVINGMKITKSTLANLDRGLLRTFLLATQRQSKIETNVINMLYEEEVEGKDLIYFVSKGRGLDTKCPLLTIGQWVKIRRVFEPFSDRKEDIESSNSLNLRGNFGRFRVFLQSDINLMDTKRLGSGNYGYAVLVKISGLPKPVVLKRNRKPMESYKCLYAIDQMGTHANLLNVIGYVTLDNDICLISEYCEKGSLEELARAKKIAPTDSVVLSYAKSIASGLLHLHAKDIVHRDLRAANILVHNDGRVVIADYGLSRKLPAFQSYYRTEIGLAVPERWVAPECLRTNRYTYKGDIWSFGVTLYELLTRGDLPYWKPGNAPYYEQGWKKIRSRVLDGTIRLIDEKFVERFDVDAPTKAIEIANRCLQFDENIRPNSRRVLEMVKDAMGINVKDERRPGRGEDEEELEEKDDLSKEDSRAEKEEDSETYYNSDCEYRY